MANNSDFTYGRNYQGVQQLADALEQQIENIKSALVGAEYETIIKQVKANWVGEDADMFLKRLSESRNELLKKCDSFKKPLRQMLGADYINFAQHQAKMSNAINSSISRKI